MSDEAPRSDRAQSDVDQAITVEKLNQLIDAAERQTASNEDLAKATVEYQERARLARARFRITLALIVVVFGVLYWRQQSTNDAAQKARDTLLDCVQPTGHCYRQGQAKTAQLVGQLNQVTTLAAACAPSYVNLPLPTRIVAIEHCIKRGLK